MMRSYLTDLVCDLQMADVSSKLIVTRHNGPNMVYINGVSVPDILKETQVKLGESDNSCDQNTTTIIKFARPTLDWKKDIIEDIPDILMKNAIAKVFADLEKNSITVL